MPDIDAAKASAGREFLRKLWRLENDGRPGFIIGNLGGTVTGGRSVRSALFSVEGTDTVRDRLLDPEKYLRAQLAELDDLGQLQGDMVPSVCPALGVIGIPSAFGCEVIWWEKDFPAVKPLPGADPERARELAVPSVENGELGRMLRYTVEFIEATGRMLPVRQAETQGPLDSAALVLGHTGFLSAMYTHPDEVHLLLRRVTDLFIDFTKAQRELVRSRGVVFVPSMFQPWMPDGEGIAVSHDECAMMSADMHDRFGVPYLNEISEEFGGVYVHSCGSFAHLAKSLSKVRDLRGLEFGASEAPFPPVFEHFSGKTVLACRVGLHRDLKFRGMADFVRSVRSAAKTSRGLFLHVDITNGIVDEDWPVTDLDEIYRLVGAGG